MRMGFVEDQLREEIKRLTVPRRLQLFGPNRIVLYQALIPPEDDFVWSTSLLPYEVYAFDLKKVRT
jgi:hypothetical protein